LVKLVDGAWFGWLVGLASWLVGWFGLLVGWLLTGLAGWLVGCIHDRPSIKFDASHPALLQQS